MGWLWDDGLFTWAGLLRFEWGKLRTTALGPGLMVLGWWLAVLACGGFCAKEAADALTLWAYLKLPWPQSRLPSQDLVALWTWLCCYGNQIWYASVSQGGEVRRWAGKIPLPEVGLSPHSQLGSEWSPRSPSFWRHSALWAAELAGTSVFYSLRNPQSSLAEEIPSRIGFWQHSSGRTCVVWADSTWTRTNVGPSVP